MVLGKNIGNVKDITIKDKIGNIFTLPNIIENVGFEICINGQYEPQTIKLISDLLPPGGFFIDIGANIGSIVIPLCLQKKDIKSIAIEASPWIFKYLVNNVDLNLLGNIILYNNAISDKDNFEVDFYAPHDKYGKGSFSPIFTSISEKVRTRTVDSIIKDFPELVVDVLKVDVEGYEYFVFKGAEELLNSNKAPFIIFEFVEWAENSIQKINIGEAQEYLFSIGYKVYIIEENRKLKRTNFSMKSGSFNLLAVPPCKNIKKLTNNGYTFNG